MKELTVKSPAFENNKLIPSKYTCDGEEVSPPLIVEGVPEKTRSLALIMEDPDAPAGLFIHWLVWNIPPTDKIQENSVPGIEGLNTNKKNSYHGPCPPGGTHRYYFKVYALDTHLNLSAFSEKEVLENAIQNHILAHGELVGLYRRVK
jgi:Raf kinase inhibitor-like YbhB/YbcL family protein